MPNAILTWDLTAIPVVILVGTVLHFCFEWSGRRRALAVFCPVNESVWEHLKMAYWPLVLFTGVQVCIGAGAAGLSTARAIGFAVMCAMILALFVVSVAAAPRAGMRLRLAMDGAIFVVSVSVGQVVCYLVRGSLVDVAPLAGAGLLAAPAAVFALTTFAPPRMRLFQDQVTGGYGIAAGRS